MPPYFTHSIFKVIILTLTLKLITSLVTWTDRPDLRMGTIFFLSQDKKTSMMLSTSLPTNPPVSISPIRLLSLLQIPVLIQLSLFQASKIIYISK